VIDLEAGTAALHDLRRTRRSNRLAEVHWIDALYRVYMAGLVGIIAVVLASGALPDDKLTTAEAADWANHAPMWLGLGIALAVGIGLRSGGRGGPLVLEAPVVMHEMNAPVPRAEVVKGPAFKQLRFLAFAGAVVGALVGELSSRRLPVNLAAAVICTGITFSLAAVLGSSSAMAASGRRLKWWPANLIAALVIGWSVLDITTGHMTSPLTLLAQIAFWPITFRATALVGVVVVAGVVVMAFRRIGDISLEHALRRAGLVSQLRFAVTLQDVRTVVLLRRQLSQERPRVKPWIKIGRAKRRSVVPPVWKRDWQSYLRFPLPRLLRMALLGGVAGLSLGYMWRGAIPAVVVAGLALYLAAYDAAEPTAQEVDHPTRWESYPDSPGRLLLNHLIAAVVVMLFVCLVAAAAALVLVPPSVVLELGIVVLAPAVLASTVAATISTAQGAPDVAGLAGLGPDMMGWVMLARVIIPPAITIVALLPLLAAGSDENAVNTTQVGNASVYALFLAAFGMIYIYTRKPKHA